jgi:hypothetical protein
VLWRQIWQRLLAPPDVGEPEIKGVAPGTTVDTMSEATDDAA